MTAFYFYLQVKQHEFRENFRLEPIFKMNLEEPYRLIDKVRRGRQVDATVSGERRKTGKVSPVLADSILKGLCPLSPIERSQRQKPT